MRRNIQNKFVFKTFQRNFKFYFFNFEYSSEIRLIGKHMYFSSSEDIDRLEKRKVVPDQRQFIAASYFYFVLIIN